MDNKNITTYSIINNIITIIKTKNYKRKYVISIEKMSMKCFRSTETEKTYIEKNKKKL